MKESGYYPFGAEHDVRAPYNEVEIPLREFPCTVSCTISRTVNIATNEYYLEEDEEDRSVSAIPDGVNWGEEYKEWHHTPIELIKELEGYVERDLANTTPNTGHYSYLKRLLADCKDWTEDELEVIQD